MSKDAKMIDFASQNNFNLTGSLSNDQVKTLAQAWLPQIRFHEKDKYHPISLSDYFTIPGSRFDNLSEEEKKKYKFTIAVDNSGVVIYEEFTPAVLKVDGPVRAVPGINGNTAYVRTNKVLSSGSQILSELLNDEVGEGAEISQGNGAQGAEFFFGAKATLGGNSDPTDTDPFEPLLPLKIITEYKVLIDLLEYELLVENDSEYPRAKDKLRGGFDITRLFFLIVNPNNNTPPISRSLGRNLLLGLIAAWKANDNASFQNIISSIPARYSFNYHAWKVLTRHAFLEYYFCYAYNDWQDYENDWFSNYHEGDLEGCCLVFNRENVELAFATNNPDPLSVTPLSIITSVHEEYQDLDRYKEFNAAHARDDLKVWVALGSHATYLSPGNHDVVDLGVLVDTSIENLGVLTIPLFPLILLAALIEHFIDVEDQTSDDGVFTDSNPPANPSDKYFDNSLEVTPLSSGDNIYENGDLIALSIRSYPGKLGGTSGIKNKSSNFENKSGRYFRKLMRNFKDVPIID